MEQLPDDVTRSILYLLDDESLANACKVNENFSKKICNDTFWIGKIIRKYPALGSDDIKRFSRRSYWDYYLQLNEETGNGEYDFDVILSEAIGKGRVDLVKIALRNGASYPNSLIALGGSKLSSDVIVEIANLLIYHGADIHYKDDFALIYAAGKGKTELVRLLIDRGSGNLDRALRDAAEMGHVDTVRLLLERGADVHNKSDVALYYATTKGHKDVINVLLEYGADPERAQAHNKPVVQLRYI